jgi:hypothetical protein
VTTGLFGVLLAAAPPAVDPQIANVPGTYELLVCKGPCSFGSPENVAVRGVLVLTAERFTTEAINPFSPQQFKYAYSFSADPNGCFVIDTVKEKQTYAGIIELGLTSWTSNAGRVRFDLYASADAWHSSTVTVSAGGFEGTGGSGGVGLAEAHLGPDILKGRRIGPANLDACVNAATEHQRKGEEPHNHGLQPTDGAPSSRTSRPIRALRAAGG